jgi:hypothetical protein
MSDELTAKELTWVEAAKLLWKLGHAPEFQELADAFLSWAAGGGIAELVSRYQEFHKLEVTGRLDNATAEHMLLPRCGLRDALAASATMCQWPTKDLTYWQAIAFPSEDPAVVAANYAEAWNRWAAVCGITVAAVRSQTEARVVAVGGPIDGPGNILAESELPCGANARSVMTQTFDIAETLTQAQQIACMCHEIGHALGLGHAAPGSGNLMEPVLSVIDRPQAGDIAEIQARYGPPVPVPPVGGQGSAGDPFGTGVVIRIPEAGNYLFRLSLAKR